MSKKQYLMTDSEGASRCWWCGTDREYIHYHDREWGVPTKNERRLFEKVCLEGFQSGLSWITILRKRENFREAFAKFEIEKVSLFQKRQVEKLLKNEGIIRHRGKIEATINNAQRALELREERISLPKLLWKFEPETDRPFDPKRATTDESVAMSKELKKRGWKFVGPTTCYSLMQAMGMVNDHHPDCHRYEPLQLERKKFKRP